MLWATGATDRLPADTGVLLTFDDGPDPDVTPAVLDLLAEFDAKAVFFVVGNRVPRAPKMLSRILAEGHLVGNHSDRHPLDKTPALFDYYRDVERCQSRLEALTGIRPRLFRPPLGSITLGSLLAPRLAGLRPLFWSLETRDWTLRGEREAKELGRQLAEVAVPGDVVLMHDDNPCVLPLLRNFLPHLVERNCPLASSEQLKKQFHAS